MEHPEKCEFLDYFRSTLPQNCANSDFFKIVHILNALVKNPTWSGFCDFIKNICSKGRTVLAFFKFYEKWAICRWFWYFCKANNKVLPMEIKWAKLFLKFFFSEITNHTKKFPWKVNFMIMKLSRICIFLFYLLLL